MSQTEVELAYIRVTKKSIKISPSFEKFIMFLIQLARDLYEKCEDDEVLPDKVEVGDVAVIQSLTTVRGLKLNGYYGKVTSWDDATQRFAVKVEGKTVAIKPENLGMGMKDEEMSSSDEKLLLSLKPTGPEVQAMPWVDRMRHLGMLGEGSRGSADANVGAADVIT